MSCIVHGDREREYARIIADDKHRPRRNVLTGDDTVEVDKGQLLLHGKP
jgi:hypothetical protein